MGARSNNRGGYAHELVSMEVLGSVVKNRGSWSGRFSVTKLLEEGRV